jgi:hypothetical protein
MDVNNCSISRHQEGKIISHWGASGLQEQDLSFSFKYCNNCSEAFSPRGVLSMKSDCFKKQTAAM